MQLSTKQHSMNQRLDQLTEKCNLEQMLKTSNWKSYFGQDYWVPSNLVMTMSSFWPKVHISSDIYYYTLTQQILHMQLQDGRALSSENSKDMRFQSFLMLSCIWRMIFKIKKVFSASPNFYPIPAICNAERSVLKPFPMLHSLNRPIRWRSVRRVSSK